jgi:hypothetical protein
MTTMERENHPIYQRRRSQESTWTTISEQDLRTDLAQHFPDINEAVLHLQRQGNLTAPGATYRTTRTATS